MSYTLSGTPSDQLPDVLASGQTDVKRIFASLSAREETGRDVDYLVWHSLDHRPEQHRLAGIRQSIRLVSTPECRASRAASDASFDAVDHVMTYFFTEDGAFDQFKELSDALCDERRPFRLPSVYANYFSLAGKVASPAAIAGADVIPWRPATGVYLLVEQGELSPESLVKIPGVAGIWWLRGGQAPLEGFPDNNGMQITYCFLDGDPLAVAENMKTVLNDRWRSGDVVPLLAAPFYTLVPFEWDRYLP